MNNDILSTNKKIAIESLAMDLKRVALGLHRGSLKMAERFIEESFKRIDELGKVEDSYLNRLLKSIKRYLKDGSIQVAEDILMYSTLIQNYAVYRYNV